MLLRFLSTWFFTTIGKLEEADLVYKVTNCFAITVLHPNAISNHGVGLIFEEQIRRFAEARMKRLVSSLPQEICPPYNFITIHQWRRVNQRRFSVQK